MGERIRELRLAADLTQAELAKALGVARESVTYWEMGKNIPTTDKLPKLAEALGCSIGDLFQRQAV